MNRILADEVAAERRTLDGVIYSELRGRIVSLDYPPGRMIYENEIAAEFGVSRTPVRQAFLRLAIDDLLQILPQRGARVSYLSRVKVIEAQAVRESLEATAFAEAARRWDKDDPLCRALLAEITAILAEQDSAVATRDYATFTLLDETFHQAIIRFAGNLTLLRIVGEMRLVLNRLRYVELQEARHDAEAVGHHRAILAAIRRGDVAETTARLVDHLKMLEGFRETLFDTRRDMFV